MFKIGNGVLLKYTETNGETEVIIPNGITRIAFGAFKDCYNLTNIIIPNSVTSIGNWAFRGCSSLTSVTIPDSMTSIGDWTFYECKNVTIKGKAGSYAETYAKSKGIPFMGVAFPLSNTSKLNADTISAAEATVDENFEYEVDEVSEDSGITITNYQGSDTKVVIPAIINGKKVTSIGNHAFSYCKNLTSVTIPDSVMSIGKYAFYGCKGLADKNGFVIIRNILYSYHGNDSEVTIPNGVTSIGDRAFGCCTSLVSVTIPDSVTNIGKYAFEYCKSLTSITIPDSVTNIEYGVFYGCTNLTSVTIPDSVTSIGNGAFALCESLTAITIPDSVINIGKGAFRSSKNFKTKKANYKAFDFQKGKLECRGFKYREGKWSKKITDILICERGYHFCDNLFAVFNYYSGEIDKDIVIYECEVGDKIETDGIKSVTNKIKPVKRLYRKDIIKILNNIN